MNIIEVAIEIFLMAIALSMDAFAVAMCKGLSIKKISIKAPVIVGIYFGGFQALMPLIGYALSRTFERYIVSFDHWIAFVLLLLIGFNMIKESRECDCENETDASLGFKSMVVLAVATSIDALAGGVTIFAKGWEVFSTVTIIGVTTFILSALGVKIGNIFGSKYKSKAELLGGVILILMGIKILLEHMFF